MEQLLSSCVDDLKMLATLPVDPSIYHNFANVHKRRVWYRSSPGVEIKEDIPLYYEVTFIDPKGVKRIHVKGEKILSPFEKVSSPVTTEFGKENYFQGALSLGEKEIYVSHLTGYHITRDEHLNGATFPGQASGGKPYRGIIRFAVKKMAGDQCLGVVSLALDHRHLMEFTQHVVPFGHGEVFVPSYRSGNYAFMFDNQGWMVTHPKVWDIRGSDALGNLVDPASKAYGETE